jgi:hypothetical protein
MLDPKEKQVDYSELLIPPSGFLMDRAIGTTYSIDLQALLAVPVAMFYSKPLETNFDENREPLDVFESISRAAKNVTIFCQKGKIKVPKKFNKLISFTEDCVVEIKPDNPFSSFHPKCWWLWFRNPKTGEKIIRFAVLSRNLTFDRSWDLSFCFEGLVSLEQRPENNSMIDMLNYLEKVSGKKIERSLKSDLSKVIFKNDLSFISWYFHPIGIGSNYVNPLLSKNYKPEVLLMMSPFVDDESVSTVGKKSVGKTWLFSRKTEMQKLIPDTYGYLTDAFCIPVIIVDGERIDTMADDVPNSEPQPLDLHAKLYVSRKGDTSTWLLGSANLTQPAFGRNVECLIELKTKEHNLSPEFVYKELVSTVEEKKLFEQFLHTENFESDANALSIDAALRRIVFDMISCPFAGKVIPDQARKYFSYQLSFDATLLKIEKDFKIYIQPFSEDVESDLGKQIKSRQVNTLNFTEQIKESMLSKYFIFSITHKGTWQESFLMKAEITLPESRHGKILGEIINSKEKFLQYLRFLLSDSGIIDDLMGGNEQGHIIKNNGNETSIWSKYSIPLYEELLKAASQHPQKLKSIDEAITKLQSSEETKEIVSPELLEFWNVFKQVIR